MDAHGITKIKDIKNKVIAMLEERHANTVASPSKLWSEGCAYFDYMLGLPEESYSKLRLHTYHFTADNYQIYSGDSQDMRTAVDTLTKDIPPEFILNEPEGGIGFRYGDGRFISKDILRFQGVVSCLYRQGFLTTQSLPVLEIGAGYGGLLHHLSKILGGVTCVIVDLPEMLLFSASYLSLLNPHKKIYIYDSSDFLEFIGSSAARTYDFILIPNYRLNSLQDWQFGLVINLSSFQEMRTDQVNEYLDFISETCTGVLYSMNMDCHPHNSELGNLSEMLSARFELMEVFQPRRTEKTKLKLRKALVSVATLVGLLDRPKEVAPYAPYREYICRPKQS